MLIRRPSDIPSSEITPESLYLRRREFIARVGGAGVALAGLSLAAACGRDEPRTEYASDGSMERQSGF